MTYSVVSAESGHVALGLAIRKLNVAGTFMQAPAHPDDETNALFALFSYGMGLRVDRPAEQPRRGRPERDRARAVPRHRRAAHLGAARRRTASTAPSSTSRAPSTTATPSIPQEVIDKWGREEIVGDYVRLIRTLRPDVVRDDEHPGRRRRPRARGDDGPGARGVRGGGRSDEVSGADREGLRPWQPKKLYFTGGRGVIGGRGGRGRARRRGVVARQRRAGAAGRGTGAGCRTSTRVEHGGVRRAARPDLRRDRHRRAQQSQVPGHGRRCPASPGIAAAVAAAAAGRRRRSLSADGLDDPRPDGEGRDVAVRRHRHEPRRTRASTPARIRPPALTRGPRGNRRRRRSTRQKAFDVGQRRGDGGADRSGPDGRARAARAARRRWACQRRRALRDRLPAADQKERDYQDAVIAAHGLTFDAIADDGLVIAGQPVKLSLVGRQSRRRGRRRHAA